MSLSSEQKNLVLDLYFGCADSDEIERALVLVAENREAAGLYKKMGPSMEIMGSLQHSDVGCPDHLVDRTLEKLSSMASSNAKLSELIGHHGGRSRSATTTHPFWRRAVDLVSVAAAILVVCSIYFPTVNNMRYKSWDAACKANIAGVFQGVDSYQKDNQGNLPQSATVNSPWWKVGYQGQENYSNTRGLWKLVKGGYAEPGDFVCQGSTHGKTIRLLNEDILRLRDFPSKKYITYSFRLISNKAIANQGSNVILMSDTNPVFVDIHKGNQRYDKNSKEFKALELCKKLRRSNSPNHRSKGQNIMFSGGNVIFSKTRVVNVAGIEDDIYTVRGKNVYTGCELPSDDADVFLVP